MRDSIRGLLASRNVLHGAVLSAVCLCASTVMGATFETPQPVTDGSAKHRLARNAGSCAAFDSAGRLHLAYWSGGESTVPAAPSAVLHRSWMPSGGWSTETMVDNSYYDTGSGLVKYGGRQPSLAIGADDSVWIAWHDHRHSNPDPPSNGIDNLEIYADRMPSGGAFSATDIRITATSAGTTGDNGYFARVVAAPSGIVSVVWYDFTVDVSVADLYARHSDATGDFGAQPAMSSMRLTDKDARAAFTSYVVPDVAVNASGVVATTWTSGVGGTAPARFAIVPNPAATLVEAQVAAQCAGYFDPPKIAAEPGGDFWVVWTDTAAATRDIRAARWRTGLSSFDATIAIAENAAVEEHAADIAVGADGRLHFAWIEGTGSARTVRYALRDSAGTSQLDSGTASASAGSWDRPAVALDAFNRPHVVFEEDTSPSAGRVWFAAAPALSSAANWEAYR